MKQVGGIPVGVFFVGAGLVPALPGAPAPGYRNVAPGARAGTSPAPTKGSCKHLSSEQRGVKQQILAFVVSLLSRKGGSAVGEEGRGGEGPDGAGTSPTRENLGIGTCTVRLPENRPPLRRTPAAPPRPRRPAARPRHGDAHPARRPQLALPHEAGAGRGDAARLFPLDRSLPGGRPAAGGQPQRGAVLSEQPPLPRAARRSGPSTRTSGSICWSHPSPFTGWPGAGVSAASPPGRRRPAGRPPVSISRTSISTT